MDHVASGGYEMVGTFNGNPLAMSLIIVIVGYRLLTRGERGSGLPALAAISGET